MTQPIVISRGTDSSRIVRTRGDDSHRLEHNVTSPRLDLFLPTDCEPSGEVVLVLPGGAFHFLAIDHEGADVARWLAARGIVAAVLHHRLAKTPVEDEAFLDWRDAMDSGEDWHEAIPVVAAMGVEDVAWAMTELRRELAARGVENDRTTVMGFSAGGGIALVSSQLDEAVRPDLVADIYGVLDPALAPGPDAPPLFVVASTDDPTVPFTDAVEAHARWTRAGVPAELHLYAEGGHGYGMRHQGLPSDEWIEAFARWLASV